MFKINQEISPLFELAINKDCETIIISKIGKRIYMLAEPVDEGVVKNINIVFSHNDIEDKGIEDNRDYIILSDNVIYIDNLEDDLKSKLGIELDTESSKFWEDNAEFI